VDIEELLRKVDLQLGSISADYIQPNRQVVCLQFLVHAQIASEEINNYAQHWYFDDPMGGTEFYELVIIRGHNSDEVCTGPTMCHLRDYWPGPEFNPRFVNQFKMKWESIYEERGWKK